MPTYPTIQFLVKHGHRCAIVMAALGVLAGLGLAWMQLSWFYGVGGIVAGVVLYVLTRSYVELVQIIADMLLPR